MTQLSVVYSTDTNYVPHMAASMLSVMENNRQIDELKFYILDGGISDADKEKLNAVCAEYRRELVIASVADRLENAGIKSKFNLNSYARLFLSDIVKEDRALYLDCDTIVNGSLVELCSLDMTGYWVAGVRDTVSDVMRHAVGLKNTELYVNAGVVLFNLKLWRENRIETLFEKCIDEFHGNVPHNDQGIINRVCHEHMLLLDLKYDVYDTALFFSAQQLKDLFLMPEYYSQEALDCAGKNPVIIHYTEYSYGRPWFKDCSHPYKNVYKKYRKLLNDKWPMEELCGNPKKKRMRILKKIAYRVLPFSIYARLMTGKRRKRESVYMRI